MGKMVRAVLFALMAVFSTAVFAEDEDPCAMPENLTEIEGVYQIGTCGDLYKFAEMVNGGETGINGRLTADIDLNGSDSKQWTPIGTEEKPYKGTFDGDGHTISGLYFNNEGASFVGLFGIIDYDAKVQNVGVVDSYIRGAGTVGGVVGWNIGGSISNVYNTGAVSGTEGRVGGVVGWNIGGTVSNVYNTGAVSGLFDVGGVVGLNIYGTVSNVYNTGAVSGENWVGGVVGYNEGSGTVSNVYNTGAVSGSEYVGGVVGYNEGTVSNVYNIGAVSSEDRFVGGVVGYNTTYTSLVKNAYYNTDSYTGSAVGEIERGEIENVEGKTTAELAALDVARAFENSDGVWVAGYDSISNGWRKYASPSLKGVGTAPTFIELDPNATEVEISNVEELLKFAEFVNAGNTTLNAKLTADIVVNEGVLKADGTLDVADASKFVKWAPIGTDANPYIGTFDGQGHTISGLYFNNDEMSIVGFFGAVGSDGETKGVVKNVGVVDSYFEGNFFVGGVVGLVMENASVNAVFNTGAVSGQVNVGGVVGVNGGGFVTNVYNTGSVSGEIEDVGGVIGLNVGEARNVYSVGPVSGKFAVGGVVGLNEGGYVANAYYNSEVFEGDSIGGGNGTSENVGGKTSAELAAGTDVVLDADFWVVGAVSENVKQDTLYYPYLKVFGPHKYVLGDVKKYAITVAVNDKTMGTVTGAGEYEYGTEVEIKAVANEGYKFTDWEDDVNTAARTITVTKAETYTANFEAIPSSSSSAKSSSSSAKSSSSEAKSSSSDAKSSSSQKESIIAQAQLPQFSVTASGKMVSIAGARPNSIVNVFDMQGNMVKTVVATAANFTFALPSAGVYIVKNGYTAKRVNVR